MTGFRLDGRAAPHGWNVVPAGYLFRREKRTGFENEQLLSVYRDYGVVPKNSRDDNFNKASEDLRTYQFVEPNDLVINKMKAWQGSLGVSEHRGIVSPAYFVASPTRGFNRRFVHYLLRSEDYLVEYQTRSAGIRVNQWDLDWEDFRRIPLFLPSETEQESIANFLDEQTARIDALIAEKERLLEHLNELRESIVTAVVTRGLDSGVSLVDSGSEWTGHIPRHWKRVRLGHLVSKFADGPHFSPSYVEEGYPFLSARNIKVDHWSLDDVKFIDQANFDEFSKRVVPEPGDVLYTKGGTTGIARYVDLGFPFQVWVHVAVLKLCKKLVNGRFLAHALNGKFCYAQSQLFTYGATNNDFGLSRMARVQLALPPLTEQASIAGYLDTKTEALRETREHVETHISHLREYRSSLISAAVTGQLDINAYQTAKAAELEVA